MRAMDTLATSLEAPVPLPQARQRIVEATLQAVHGADFASITVLHNATGHLETTAATDTLVCELDQIQYELKEGPCLDAVTKQQLVMTSDLRSDPRWPHYSRHANTRGVRSQVAVRLRNGAVVTGLNLYSKRDDVFHEPLDDVRLMARYARMVLGYAAEIDGLSTALETRTEIGEAIGILMERYQLDSDAAFRFLVRVSQQTNTKLRQLAHTIVSGGDIQQE
jgi:Cu/Ag efflux protein CusF